MNWRIIICVVGFLMGGCSLNIPLEDQFSDPDAITDVLSARSLLASAYEGLPQHLFEYSVLSDDFCPTQYLDRDATLKNLYDWREVEMTELAGTLWTEYYMVVAEVNALLARMDGVITLNDAEVEEKERIICEAKDGIILKDRVELDFLPRSSMKVCVEEIRKLLKEARNEKNTLKNVHWLSDKSIAYLQVELELYAGNYPAVLEQTESLETVYPETVLGAGAYETLWSGSDSEARIFAKYQLAQIYEEIRFETFDKGDYLVLTDEVLFEEGDIRKEWSEVEFVMPDSHEVRLLGKYNKMNRDEIASKYVNIARAAGMWLMRAEALARSDRSGDAVSLMNRMMEQRGATAWEVGLSGNELINKILEERRKEFVGEGVRFFDMKRCGIPAKRYGVYGNKVSTTIKSDDYRWTLPIPASEYRYNTLVEQNEGWPVLAV